MSIGKVGSKGELFPPKEIREKLDLKEGQKVKYTMSYGRLIVEKILTPEEILLKPSKVMITIDEIKKNRQELSDEAEK
jgi:AbrB family looped-hinge helix DNA binding protein